MLIKKYFLLFAFSAVVIIALLYGVSPQWFMQDILSLNEPNIDIAHILRAVMGLYLSLSLFWLYAAFNEAYRNVAVLTCLLFAGGLVTGRLISLIFDGLPSGILILYVAMEFILVPVAYWVLKQPD
ncbi:MAG: DUF4345 domain-containing protein [Methyloprofundus sp.]|nr:DUF4345 domain-containing protein [Methyloprofundus sp.]